MADNRKSRLESLLTKELDRPTHERMLESPYSDQQIRAVKNPTVYSIGEAIDKNPLTRFLGSGLSDYLKTVGKGGRAGFGKSLMAALDVAPGAHKVGGKAVGIVKSNIPMFKGQVKVTKFPKSEKMLEARKEIDDYLKVEDRLPDMRKGIKKTLDLPELPLTLREKIKKRIMEVNPGVFKTSQWKKMEKELADIHTKKLDVQTKLANINKQKEIQRINYETGRQKLLGKDIRISAKNWEQYNKNITKFQKENDLVLQKLENKKISLQNQSQELINKSGTIDNKLEDIIMNEASEDLFKLRLKQPNLTIDSYRFDYLDEMKNIKGPIIVE